MERPPHGSPCCHGSPPHVVSFPTRLPLTGVWNLTVLSTDTLLFSLMHLRVIGLFDRLPAIEFTAYMLMCFHGYCTYMCRGRHISNYKMLLRRMFLFQSIKLSLNQLLSHLDQWRHLSVCDTNTVRDLQTDVIMRPMYLIMCFH